MRLKILIPLLIFFLAKVNLYALEAKIVRISGEVKYRQGVEET
jgi:hypothetical protein